MLEIDLLRRISLFASLPTDELELMARTLHRRHLVAGEFLLQEGQQGNPVYVLLEGQVEILKNAGAPDERLLGVRQPGTLLGEMSLFSQDQRSTASVRALTPLNLFELTRAEFNDLLHRQPDLAYALVGLISARLEQSENTTIQELREKNRQLTQAYQELQAAQAEISEKEKLERELDIARRIQRSILPNALPRRAGFEMGAKMAPARAVGGDFYDFIPLGEGKLGVVVGDVSDKGVPAALYMALTYSLLRAEARRSPSPARVLRAVNRHLLEMSVREMYVTAIYGVLDADEGRFTYARAGQPAPLALDGQGQRRLLQVDPGQPLGLLGNPLLDEQSMALPPGGIVMLYSDGVTEAADPQEIEFGEQRLLAALQANRDAPVQSTCDRLWQIVTDYCAAPYAQDDITLVEIKRLATDS